jgi:hypothetical protein
MKKPLNLSSLKYENQIFWRKKFVQNLTKDELVEALNFAVDLIILFERNCPKEIIADCKMAIERAYKGRHT